MTPAENRQRLNLARADGTRDGRSGSVGKSRTHLGKRIDRTKPKVAPSGRKATPRSSSFQRSRRPMQP